VAWARHEGAAATLVRRLKYDGVGVVAVMAAREMVELLPAGTGCLVPVPRSVARRIRYGIDPALTLATALGRLAGVPVVHALSPALWTPANAGASRARRVPPTFRRRFSPVGVTLVDDVVTTGETIDSAAATLTCVVGALTMTGVP
jgi:predicted amidophosphoribosyltransferase